MGAANARHRLPPVTVLRCMPAPPPESCRVTATAPASPEAFFAALGVVGVIVLILSSRLGTAAT
jgi:MYXO-CTERM domain-containing protein